MSARSLHALILLVSTACGSPAVEGSTSADDSSSADTGTSTTTGTGDGPTASTATESTSNAPATTSSTGPGPTTGASTTTATSDPSTSESSASDMGPGDTGDTDDTDDTDDTGAVACGEGSLGPGEHTLELEHGGRTRTALVHIPASVDLASATPLVLNFHGFTMTADGQAKFSGMSAKADAEGFIVVYPQGIDTSWNAGACCGNAMTQQIDDVGFVRALVALLGEQVCVDARRVYATGMSNGGFMSHRLACEASDIFAAVAPVSAVNGMATCDPPRPVPVMMFNGTSDLLVAYNGGGNFGKSAPATFEEWADRDGCTDAPVPGEQVGKASCERHEACDADVSVAFCTIEGMGHCWPGQAVCPYGIANTDLSANDEMWAFFSKYMLP